MKKEVIRLKESQLRQIIKESVKKVLREDNLNNEGVEEKIYKLLSDSLFYDYSTGKFMFNDKDEGDYYGNSYYLVLDYLDLKNDPNKKSYYMGIIDKWKSNKISQVEESYSNFEIPQKILNLIDKCEKIFSCEITVKDRVYLYDGGGNKIAIGAGISLTHTTSSISDGPSHDYSEEIFSFLKHARFEKSNSFGDNGMDSSTNYEDTYWIDEFIYTPTMKYLN